MSGLYRSIRDDIETLFSASWSHPDVTVYWRSNDLEVRPDPSVVAYFLRAEVDFGRELLLGFGAGPSENLREVEGSILLRVFTARAADTDDTALDLLSDATGALRSQRAVGSYAAEADLSFTGEGSGAELGPSEDGNWFVRGARLVFAYRFSG